VSCWGDDVLLTYSRCSVVSRRPDSWRPPSLFLSQRIPTDSTGTTIELVYSRSSISGEIPQWIQTSNIWEIYNFKRWWEKKSIVDALGPLTTGASHQDIWAPPMDCSKGGLAIGLQWERGPRCAGWAQKSLSLTARGRPPHCREAFPSKIV